MSVFYFAFGSPRVYHRMTRMSLVTVFSACGIERNNNNSIRWSKDPRGKVCDKCRRPTHVSD